MEQRKEFLEAAMRGEHSFTELCRRFGISRKNGYKWLDRYRIELLSPTAGCRSRIGLVVRTNHPLRSQRRSKLRSSS